jgi:hypothetical protein
MKPLLLIFMFCCFSKVETSKPPEDIALSGSYCFDGFIRNFINMDCKNKKTGEGPIDSVLFSCQQDKTSVTYFAVIPSTVEEVNAKMIICQDDFIFLVKYEDQII